MSFAVWFTGPPAAGKSTLARAVRDRLAAAGVRAVILESDALRKVLTPEPSYTREERDRFYAEVAGLAALIVSQAIPVLVDATASRREYRAHARRLIPAFFEVFVDAPLALREARDPKGLYRKARGGGAPRLPGIGVPYEEAREPDLAVSGEEDPGKGADAVVALLAARGLLGT